MPIYSWLIISLWLLFVVFWVVSAVGVKRNIGGAEVWRRKIGLRIGIFVLGMLVLRIPALQSAQSYMVNTSALRGCIGVVLCAFGVGLAIWARVYLGRNWGMPASRKENPELVTGGPYAYIRHPIYSGLLLAMFGSAVGRNTFWVVPFVLFGAYFIDSARREEKFMLEQFPEQYPVYMKRTKMLLPFVL